MYIYNTPHFSASNFQVAANDMWVREREGNRRAHG